MCPWLLPVTSVGFIVAALPRKCRYSEILCTLFSYNIYDDDEILELFIVYLASTVVLLAQI